MDDVKNAESIIGQRGKAFGQTWPLGIVAILVPPAIFDEMQAVFHLPMVAALRVSCEDR